MKEQLITFDTAKLAKEKGFNIPVLYDYNNGVILEEDNRQICNFNDSGWKDMLEEDYNSISAPTQSLLQKWLREEKDFHIIVGSSNVKGYNFCISSEKGLTGFSENTFPYETYEEALESALQSCLSFIV